MIVNLLHCKKNPKKILFAKSLHFVYIYILHTYSNFFFFCNWGCTPVSLSGIPSQGLALINGTQMITSLGAEAVERAQAIAQQADIIAALTLEVLKGTTKAFDSGEQKL